MAIRPRLAAANGEATPNPIEHATPDVELADAQLALGRPDLAEAGDADEAEEEYEFEDAGGGVGGRPPSGVLGGSGGSGGGAGGGGVAIPAGGAEPLAERRAGILARLIGFLQGSWRELQRVQWPDRRQVAQATAVVIGFVIVAGVFLGVADLLASHLMTFILNGHW
jgi:preprotein translocase SecE subunit